MKNLLLFASLLAASLTANAATFQGNTSATFENPTGGSHMVTTGTGTNQFTWGKGASGVKYGGLFSGCLFGCSFKEAPSKLKATGTNFNAEVDQTFIAGYLDFYNGKIVSNTGADSVDLSLSLNFSSPSSFSETFNYGFSLENTINPQGDKVSFIGSVPTKFYSYAGTDYYFELLGFGIHDNKTIKLVNEISLAEGSSTKFKLLGQFTSMPSEVPLPAAVWLFGSGLMGFMAMRRKAKAQA